MIIRVTILRDASISERQEAQRLSELSLVELSDTVYNPAATKGGKGGNDGKGKGERTLRQTPPQWRNRGEKMRQKLR